MNLIDDSRSRSQVGYDFLVERILGGKLQPGDEINRKEIAEELGVSLAPINEAVGQLETEGFLEVMPRRQTRVRVVHREEVRGLLILREAIECQAARLYCGVPVKTHLTRLKRLAAAVDKSRPASSDNENAETEFHGALVDLVEVPLLSAEFRKIMRRRLFCMIHTIAPWHTQPPLDNHGKLLIQLQVSSADAAEAIMRKHLQRGREAMLQG